MPVIGRVGLVNRGTYSSSDTYNEMDFVLYNGSTFVAKKTVQGVTPASDGVNWQFLASGLAMSLQNNLLTNVEGTYALDAAQGPVIKSLIDDAKSVADNTKSNLTDYVKMLSVSFTLPANATSVGVTASIPSGYEFVGWTYCSTRGWVGFLYPSTESKSTTFYTTSVVSTAARQVYAFYLVRKITS